MRWIYTKYQLEKFFLEKLQTNFEKSKKLIFSKTAEPILIAQIYVIEGTKEVLKKIREPIPSVWREWKKLLKLLNNFFNLDHPTFFSYIILTFKLTIYIFLKIIGEVLHS